MIEAEYSRMIMAFRAGASICHCGIIHPHVRKAPDARIERTCNYCRRRFMRLASKGRNTYANYCGLRCVERMRAKLGMHWDTYPQAGLRSLHNVYNVKERMPL